jgi:hypothetical protein
MQNDFFKTIRTAAASLVSATSFFSSCLISSFFSSFFSSATLASVEAAAATLSSF